MDSYHRLVDEQDAKDKDCFDENREADIPAMIKQVNKDDELNPTVLNLIFIHIFTANIIINFDHGIIPAALTELKEDLNITNTNIGILGSLVYLGLTLGALITAPTFKMFNPKYVMSITLILDAGALVIFPLLSHFWAQ